MLPGSTAEAVCFPSEFSSWAPSIVWLPDLLKLDSERASEHQGSLPEHCVSRMVGDGNPPDCFWCPLEGVFFLSKTPIINQESPEHRLSPHL